MVGDHAMAGLERPVRILAGRLGRGQDQRPERVGIVVVVLALQDRGEPLQSQPGIDRGPGQRRARAGRVLVVLHEDQIPDLDEAVAILVRRSGRASGNMVAMVEEDLRAWAARAGIAHAPEIVGGRDADDAAVRQAGDALPQVGGLVVLGIDRGQQPVGGKAELPGHHGPGELDRQRLEIVAEREIAEHLEEGVVPRGVADIVEVVVLAAGPDHLLRGGGARVRARLLSGEDVLELDHAGIGEQQRRIVARHQRAARHDPMIVRGEIVEEGGADIVARGHGAERTS